MRFNSIEQIVAHIRGKFPHMVWVGKEYSIADLVEDLERLNRELGAEIEKSNAVMDRIVNAEIPKPPPRRPLVYTIRKGA